MSVEEPELDSSFTDFTSAEKMISKMRISSNNSSITAAAIAACDKFLIDLFPSRLAPTGPSRNSDLGSKKVMER